MKIMTLIRNTDGILYGEPECDIQSIAQDSRAVGPGSLFVAIKGFQTDGHQYLNQAIENGASALVVEDLPEDVNRLTLSGVAVIHSSNTRQFLAQISKRFYGEPDEHMCLVGVTGTNGKTSLTYILSALLEAAEKPCGVIGTISVRFADELYPALGTTPESLQLMQYFQKMRSKDVQHVVMEVSSHALALDRTFGLAFKVGIFTNLTQDHLDFHETMEAYFDAKRRLFEQVTGLCILNGDDVYGQRLSQELKRAGKNVLTYGFSTLADVQVTNTTLQSDGSYFTLVGQGWSQRYHCEIPGRFNVHNFAAAICAARYLGITEAQIASVLPQVRVPGRLEKVTLEGGPTVFVDYAHTPDALEKVLTTMKEFTTGRVICVFGCGGDRDKTKRPIMGEVAERFADRVILTSDNPRTEDPDAILSDILKGMRHPDKAIVIKDRQQAIEEALKSFMPGDSILIAGKGHEDYQILGKEKIHFDDREVVRKLMGQ